MMLTLLSSRGSARYCLAVVEVLIQDGRSTDVNSGVAVILATVHLHVELLQKSAQDWLFLDVIYETMIT